MRAGSREMEGRSPQGCLSTRMELNAAGRGGSVGGGVQWRNQDSAKPGINSNAVKLIQILPT